MVVTANRGEALVDNMVMNGWNACNKIGTRDYKLKLGASSLRVITKWRWPNGNSAHMI